MTESEGIAALGAASACHEWECADGATITLTVAHPDRELSDVEARVYVTLRDLLGEALDADEVPGG